jgi:hypothetical protein
MFTLPPSNCCSLPHPQLVTLNSATSQHVVCTPANFGEKKACWILHWQAYSAKTSLFVHEPKGAKPTSPKGQSRGHRINIASCIVQCRNTRQWNSIKALHALISAPSASPYIYTASPRLLRPCETQHGFQHRHCRAVVEQRTVRLHV